MSPPLHRRCLERVTAAVASALADGPVPGAVLGVDTPQGRWLQTVGSGLAEDTVLRLSSLTKPVLAVATLAAAQDGVLSLDDPVDRWLPELAAPRVLRHPGAALDDTVPCEHRTTVEDLLTMRLGTGFAFEQPDSTVAAAAQRARLGWGPPVPTDVPHTPDAWVQELAALPLMEQPGRWWRYGTAFSLLGVLLARAEGRDLPSVLQARVTGPLGMADTGFHVDVTTRHRLVDCLVWPGEGEAGVLDPAQGSAWATPPSFPDGAGGLVGTAGDVLDLGRALVQAGRGRPMPAGPPLLTASAVRQMTTEQVPVAQRTGGGNAAVFLDPDTWGYGVSISSDGAARYGWSGGLGTSWRTYPDHDAVAVVMTQCVPPPTQVMDAFWSTFEQHLGDGGC